MANHNVTALVKAISTNPPAHRLRKGFPGDGGSAVPSPRTATPRKGECFTDMELAAAQQLVLLSESSSEDVALQAASRSSSASSSSFPSISNARLPPPAATMADEDEDDEEEGISVWPETRRRRYRSIGSLYEATSPIAGQRERGSAAQRGKKNRT